METKVQYHKSTSILRTWFVVGVCAAAVCLAPIVASAQDYPPPPPPPPSQQTSRDPGMPPQFAPPPPGMEVPQTLTIPAGTVITVRLNEWLSSDRSQAGDAFSATLSKPLIVNGWVVARRGQDVMGRVSVAQKAGRVRGTSQLGVELSELTLVDGQQMAIRTQLVQSSGGTSHGADAAAVATTTGLGALLGAIANGGSGAAIGAGAGAAAGVAGVLLTRGRPTQLAPETFLTFQLQEPIVISTERSQVAFQPVSQSDYETETLEHRPGRYGYDGRGPGYPGPYGPYYYPYAYVAPYPYYGYGFYGRPYISIYGRFGLGPRFRGRRW
jgi:hypothetical protein